MANHEKGTQRPEFLDSNLHLDRISLGIIIAVAIAPILFYLTIAQIQEPIYIGLPMWFWLLGLFHAVLVLLLIILVRRGVMNG